MFFPAGNPPTERSASRFRVNNGVMPNSNPIAAWKALTEGNERFVSGTPPQHPPSQGIDRRAELVNGQYPPTTVLFGCGDSRVAAEIIFDQGLGDMFVVRTAGHVIDSSVLGSIEYAVAILEVPLIVVLGHDSCGAVGATLKASTTARSRPGSSAASSSGWPPRPS